MTPGAASGGQRPIHECLHEEEWPLLRRLMARVDQIWEILSDVRALTKGKDGHTSESLILRVPLAEKRLTDVEECVEETRVRVEAMVDHEKRISTLEVAAERHWSFFALLVLNLSCAAAGAWLHHLFTK